MPNLTSTLHSLTFVESNLLCPRPKNPDVVRFHIKLIQVRKKNISTQWKWNIIHLISELKDVMVDQVMRLPQQEIKLYNKNFFYIKKYRDLDIKFPPSLLSFRNLGRDIHKILFLR